MPSSTMDGGLRGDYEVNMNGEPCARKPACTVREGTERKGQFVCTSLSVYLTPKYRAQLGKPQDFLDIVDDYRNLRNQIHMPGDFVVAPHLDKYTGDSLMRMLVKFINEEIVEYNNTIVEKGKLHPSYNLQALTYF